MTFAAVLGFGEGPIARFFTVLNHLWYVEGKLCCLKPRLRIWVTSAHLAIPIIY